MSRFVLILLTLCAAALPLFAHVYIFESMDGVVPRGEESGVVLFNMAWTALPVALAAILAHRVRALFLGLVAFGAEAALWGYYAVSGRATQLAPPDAPSGGADIGLGLIMLTLPLLLAGLVIIGTRPRTTGLQL